jgi:zinc protease
MIRLFIATLISLLAALPALAAVKIQEVKSPGGITAWLVEEHSIPFTAMEIRFRGGASLDAPGKRGAINLMTALIEEGAGNLDSRAFAAAQESLACTFRFDVGDDALAVSAKFLTENRDQATDLLRSALTETRFDADAIERVRQQVLSIIKSDQADPSAIASLAYHHAAWGDHPYGTSTNGTEDSVTALTRDDILDAKARVMTRDRLYVGVVGDITAEELGPLLDKILGGLPATGAPMPPRVDYRLKPGVQIVDLATPQSIAYFGQPGIRLEDPDYFAAYVVNQILGGDGLSSRLMTELRERRGLTYGVKTYVAPADLGESIVGQFASDNAKMAEAVGLVQQEWARLADKGVTQTELDDAKTYMTGAYPLRFDGNATIANILVGMQMNGFPIDYAETRNDRINAVTLDDANRVARKWFRPDQLGFVVTGQPAGLAATP